MAFNDGYQARLEDVEVTEAEQSIDDLYAHYRNVRLPEEVRTPISTHSRRQRDAWALIMVALGGTWVSGGGVLGGRGEAGRGQAQQVGARGKPQT